MSEILSNIVVEQTNINFSPDNNNLNITPEAINLNVFTAAAPVAGGPNTSVQYSNGGVLEGSADFVFDTSNNTVIANTLVISSNANLGSVSNVHISGGLNGYVLQTDGSGNLNWVAQSGAGNGSPGGSNTQVQYNDNGLFGGSSGFVFNKISGNLAVPGSISGANLIGNHYGNGSALSSITGANVTGTVANATYAVSAGTANSAATAGTAGTVTTNAQPNITSLGTLSSLTVSGTTSIFEAIENVNLIGAQTGTYNYDVLDGAIQYSTAGATANLTLNFRGNATTTLDSIVGNAKSTTVTYLMTTGITPYTISNVQIDSSVQTIKWVNGTIPPINGNSTTAYTFTLIKTSTTPTYAVLGSASRYA